MPQRRTMLALTLCAAASAVGAQQRTVPAPPRLTGVSTRGERIELEKLRGSVVLVFAWSTNCPVCLDKLPELRKNLDGWQGKPFVILALNQDRSVEDLRAYERLLESTGPMRSQLKLLWRGAPEHRDSFGELPRNAPTTFIIDKAGALTKTIRGRVPAELWDDIAELVL
jgi:thiol-disulfide isomerase/thioredoxin